jgi:putative endonuclease
MCFCYILRCADGSFYVGVAEDPLRRCDEHNLGKGADWTARRRPVELVWTETHDSLSSARKRENQLKGWSHAKKAALIGGFPSTALRAAIRRLRLPLLHLHSLSPPSRGGPVAATPCSRP